MGKLTPENLDHTLNVNVRNLILLTNALSDSLIRRRGCVVNISSVSSFSGAVWQIAYATSKGAVNSFTRNASIDLGRSGVRVNAVAPGVIDDGMWKTAFAKGLDRDKTFERMRRFLPLEGRWGTAQNVADCLAWLVGEGRVRHQPGDPGGWRDDRMKSGVADAAVFSVADSVGEATV